MHRFSQLLVRFLEKNVYWATFFFIFVTAISIPFITRLQVKPNFQDLLPSNSIAVANIKKLTELYGGEGYFILAFENGQKDMYIDLAQKIKPLLTNHDTVDHVIYTFNSDFFRKNFLLFLDREDLEEIENRINKKIEYENNKANPFHFDLKKQKPYELSIDDIKEKEKYKVGDLTEYLMSKDEKTFVFLIKPNGSPNDMSFNRNLIGNVDHVIAQTKASYTNLKDIQITAGGMYYEVYLDNNELLKDLLTLSLLAVFLITLTLLFYYKQFKTLIIIALPLLIGVMINFALTKILIGHLNLLSGFLAGILMGLGLDFGIHLFSRYLDEKDRFSWREALIRTLSNSGTASFAGAATTAVAFYALTVAKFKGFSEFGLIAGNGMVITSLCMFTVFPLSIIIYEKNRNLKIFRIEKKKAKKTKRKTFYYKIFSGQPTFYDRFKKYYGLVRIIYILLVIIAFISLKNLAFEYDFSKMKGASKKVIEFNQRVEKILHTSVKPTVIMTTNLNTIREITKEYNQRITNNEFKTVRSFKSILSFVPPEQKEKRKIIFRVGKLYGEYKDLIAKKSEEQVNIEILRDALKPEKISIENIPPEIKNKFVSEDGKTYFIMVHSKSGITYNITNYQAYTEELNSVEELKDKYTVAGISFVLTEIIKLIRLDGPHVLRLTIIGILLTVVIIFRRFKECLLIFISLFSGILFMLMAMAILDVRFNLLNVIVFPIIFGIGIDSSIHIFHRIRERTSGNIDQSLNQIYRVIILSSFTTVLGFSSLIFAGFNGLRSIGIVSIIGLSSVLVTALIFLPAFLPWFYKEKKVEIIVVQAENNTD